MPNRTDFDEAVMQPSFRLIPQHLKSGDPAVIMKGKKNNPSQSYKIPWARGGQFAVVYKFAVPPVTKAIRCFMNDVGKDMEDRYTCLTEVLSRNAASFTVGFRYHNPGIKVRGADNRLHPYPLVEMDFVEGDTLQDRLGDLCSPGSPGGRSAIVDLAKKWTELILTMRSIHLAHGDLSGGNVMVTAAGDLVLIDYDGVYFPDARLTSCPPSECGNSDYQHPNCRSRPYDEFMDSFSALAIYVALLGLAERPSLFTKYVKHDANGRIVGDNILFLADDFKSPDTSQLFGEFAGLADRELLRLLPILRQACMNGDVARVPHFEELLDPFIPLRQVIRNSPRRWAEIHRRATDCRQSQTQKPLPPDLQQPADEAEKHVRAKDELRKALTGRSVYAIRNTYATYHNLLEEWRKECAVSAEARDDWKENDQQLKKGQAAEQHAKWVDELKQANAEDRGPKGLVKLWELHAQELQDYIEAQPLRDQCAVWKPIHQACDSFLNQTRRPNPWDQDIAEAWESLGTACAKHKPGYIHPEAKPYEAKARESAKRWRCLQQLLAIRDELSEASDREYQRLWNKVVLQNCPDANRAGLVGPKSPCARWQEAEARLGTLAKLAQKISDVDQGNDQEAAIGAVAAALPVGYVYVAAARVAQAGRRDDARKKYEAEAGKPAPSERALAAAWSVWQKEYQQPLTCRPFNIDIDRVLKQVALLDELDRLLPLACNESTDGQIEKAWTDGLLRDCRDAEPYENRVRPACTRLGKVRVLRTAIADAASRRPGASAEKIADAGRGLPDEYLDRSGLLVRYQAAVKQAECTRRLRLELEKDPRAQSDLAIAKAYDELETSESGVGVGRDPGANPFRADAASSRKRRARLLALDPVFKPTLSRHDPDADDEVLKAWTEEDETLFQGRRDGKLYLDRALAARKRGSLGNVIDRVDARELDETEIVTLADELSRLGVELSEQQATRVATARERAKGILALQEAIDRGMDREIAKRWKEVQDAHTYIVAKQRRDRAELACRRVVGLDAIAEIVERGAPPDAEDEQVLRVWNGHDLESCKDAGQELEDLTPSTTYRRRAQLARERQALSSQFQQAVEGRQAARIVQLASHHLLKSYPPVQLRQKTIEKASKALELFRLVGGGEAERFLDDFDEKSVQEFAGLFGPRDVETMETWIQKRLFSRHPIILDGYRAKPQPFMRVVPQLRVYWNWRDPEKVTSCVVVAQWDRRPQSLNGMPMEERGVSRSVDFSDFKTDEYSAVLRLPPFQGKRLHVSVFPVVQLTSEKRVDGPPLYLDSLDASDVASALGLPSPPSAFRRTLTPLADAVMRLFGG